jgi:hypothetical protein
MLASIGLNTRWFEEDYLLTSTRRKNSRDRWSLVDRLLNIVSMSSWQTMH